MIYWTGISYCVDWTMQLVCRREEERERSETVYALCMAVPSRFPLMSSHVDKAPPKPRPFALP